MGEVETEAEAKPKQKKIPGFTELEDDKVEALAEEFAKARDYWQERGDEMNAAAKKLKEACEANAKIMKAAKAHPKGKVKVGDALLTITPKDPTTKIKVKLYGDDEPKEETD